MPHCLESKSVDGYTPLAVAFRSRKLEFAKILIKAGANQAARCYRGMNLFHHLLSGADVDGEENTLKEMLGLIDPLLVPSLLVERCSSNTGSLTPIALWMSTARQRRPSGLGYLRAILDFAESAGQKHLELLDGSGNTPLHTTVNSQDQEALALFIERRPDLLYRENAVGTTPAELAENKWIANVTFNPPKAEQALHYKSTWQGFDLKECRLLDSSPRAFVETPKMRPTPEDIHKLCCDKAGQVQNKKRKLVSLFDANEVARRLASGKGPDWAYRPGKRTRGWGHDGEGEAEETDEIRQWL